MKRRWILKPNDDSLVCKLCEKYNISALSAKVLQNRLSEIEKYIGLSNSELMALFHSPFLLNDMESAVAAIEDAVVNGEKITVYGDYDVDGITSTAILYTYLESIGADVNYYIPDRIDEGYGINNDALTMLRKNGTDFLITVDTGISAAEQIEYAYSLGMRVVVTDHHECPDVLPKCEAVINPKRKDSTYPYKDLAGVGVAFKLVCALNQDSDEIVRSFIDLVCIGTIADVMPITDENRAIVSLGLCKLNNTDNEGINALVDIAWIKDGNIDSQTVGYMIAPRINACGRLSNAQNAVKLLITDDCSEARNVAKQLCEINSQRQSIETKIFDEAVKIIEDNRLYNERVIVCAGDGWHHGVIGIVASKICEKYYRPTVLLTVNGDVAKGSCRSIKKFDIYDGLKTVADCLEKYGGHSLAAGLTLSTGNIVKFRNEINKYAASVTEREDYVPELVIDAAIDVDDINEQNILDLSCLEPFGSGNLTPLFAIPRVTIENAYALSGGKHLRIIVNKDGKSLNTVGFGMGNYINYLKPGDVIDICGTVGINEYNNTKTVQMVLKDIKKPKKEG